MDILAKAVELAGTHHAGQTDKAGKPYILHPLAVMHGVLRITNDTATPELLAAAAMHDLIEDTEVSAEGLRQLGFPEEVVSLVSALTRDKDAETYVEFIDRIAGHSTAAALIKLADIQHNIDVLRLDPESIDALDFGRLRRYRQAYARLLPHGLAWLGGVR